MRLIFRAVFVLLLLPAPAAMAAGTDTDADPTGLWLTDKEDTVVLIEQCEDSLCGYIAWIHPEEEQTTPDGEPLCGQKVMWGFEQSSSDQRLWKDGSIYRADKDKKYSGRIRILEDDKLRLHGYIGLPFLGKSYQLTRVRSSDYPSCPDSGAAMTGLVDE